jgi:Family of unknown function (DUF5362)
MDNNSNQSDNLFHLNIEGAAREFLDTAATWARIIAIVGFISAGLSLVAAFVSKSSSNSAAMVGGIFGALISAAITVAINLFLYRFATHTKSSLSSMNQGEFNEGIINLKTYFKILGIIMIIALALIVLLILAFGLGLSNR